MLFWLYIAQFPVLAALVVWLFAKHRQRERARIAEYEAWLAREVRTLDPGRDIAILAPRVRQVRKDFLAELKAHPHPAAHQAGRIASARQAARQKSYFHGDELAPDPAVEHVGVHTTA